MEETAGAAPGAYGGPGLAMRLLNEPLPADWAG